MLLLRRAFASVLLLAAVVGTAEAQRFELSVLGGFVSNSGKEYERVTVAGAGGETLRSTASRASSAAFGFQSSIALGDGDHWRLDGGMLFQPTTRTLRETALDDADGPYVTSTEVDGMLLSAWIAAMYRVRGSSAGHLDLFIGPMLANYGGIGYTQTEDPLGYPFPAVGLGLLSGARGAYFINRDFGIQASAEFAMFGFAVADRAQDFANPGTPTSQRNAPQREFRLNIGLIYRYF